MHVTSESSTVEAEAAEDRFFAAILAADADRVADVLAADFVVVDVLSGGVVDRAGIIGALRDGLLVFDRVDVVERAARRYGDTVIVVGRTELAGRFSGSPFTVESRYTHVLVRESASAWRLVTAQGTPIVEAADARG